MEMPKRRARWRECVLAFSLAGILSSGPALSISASQEPPKRERPSQQSTERSWQEPESKKEKKAEGEAEATKQLPVILWRDPGEIASRDLLNGQGGAKDAPDPHADYSFIKEDLNGTSPKFYAQDTNGVKWLVKLGMEARPETAATRLVWAVGYFTDEDYFLPQIHVRNLPKLRRKMFGASRKTGIVPNVRLKRHSEELEKVENWDWFENPFVGTRELNGLRTLMALINNWDLLNENNKVYVEDNERHYLVSDLGATFGKTGLPPTHVPFFPHGTKGKLKDYSRSRFIRAVKDNLIIFQMHTTAPGFIRKFDKKYFNEYRQVERLEQDIPVLDAQWIGGLLARLTPQQIRDAFRAAGYQPTEVDGFAKVVEERIAALNHLNR